MPVLIDVAAQDFPDAAQRFNWCNCQAEAPRLTAALGDIPPAALTPGSGPLTPIFDFNFWEGELSGGGGPVALNQTGSPGNINTLPAMATAAASWLLPGALAVGAIWLLSTRMKGGRRRR